MKGRSEDGRVVRRVEAEWGKMYSTFLSKQLRGEGFKKERKEREKERRKEGRREGRRKEKREKWEGHSII